MNRFVGAVAVVGVVTLMSGLLSPVAAHEQLPALASPGLLVSGSSAGSGSVEPAAQHSMTHAVVDAEQMRAAPVLGEGFRFGGQWLAPGVVGLDWDDVPGASGYELLALGTDGWVLLATDEPVDGVVTVLEGSAARVGGLPAEVDGYWFALRARNTAGVSRWSSSLEVRSPDDAGGRSEFDPFSAPTLSDIDLERLGAATATVTPGEADCGAVSALDVAGISVVDPLVNLSGTDAVPTVAEVMRIAGGCVVVEYVALEGRTVAQVRELLAGVSSVHAVGEPIRGVRVAHDDMVHPMHTGGHHNDGGGEQWHLPKSTMDSLWGGWVETNPVTVAVLDTGVYGAHRDLDSQIVTGGLGLCHRVDPHGHGTHVAGIIAAEHDSVTSAKQDTAGIAPDATILPIRVLGRAGCDELMGPTEAVAAAVNAGARVINMSLIWDTGHRSPRDQNAGGIPIERDKHQDTFEAALRAASMLGVVSVAAAGNCGDDRDRPDGLKGWQANKCSGHNFDHAPAIYSLTGDVITVAAANSTGQQRPSSTAKEFVDIAAPGGGILSSVPQLECKSEDDDGNPIVVRYTPRGCGTNPTDASCAGATPALHTSENDDPGLCAARVAYRSGTSMAAPFVSGLAAHMINRYPDATVGQIRAALENTTLAPLDPQAGWVPPPPPASQKPPPPLRARGRDGDDDLIKSLAAGLRRIRQPGRPGFHTEHGLHAPTLEYGRGIVDPAEAVARLGVDIAAAERALVPSGAEGVFEELSAGARHTCGLRMSGAVRCWGERAIRDATPSWAFASLSSPASGRFVCGVRVDGVAQCWGELPSQIISDVVVVPDTAAPPGRFSQVAAGDRHVCGLRPDGGVVCWGDSSNGRTAVPTRLRGLGESSGLQAVRVVAGSAHSCALVKQRQPRPGARVGETVLCWGGDANNQLPGAMSPAAVDVAAGASHTCAVKTTGRMECWGDETKGQATEPVGMFTAVDAGADHSCGLLARESDDLPAGRLRCWGYGGPEGMSDMRLDAPGGVFSQVSSGAKHACALTVVKDVQCWGGDEYGQAPSSFVGRLGALSLTAGGVDLLAGRFDPAVYEYTVVAEPGAATLRAATDTTDGSHSLLKPLDGSDGPLLVAQSVPKTLAGGAEFEVRVGAAFGQVGLRTYTIRVLEPVRLGSLRLVPGGSGPQCVPQCAALALDPPFDPKVSRYRTVAGSDVSELTVEYRSGDGDVEVTPADANAAVGGHQVGLSTDRTFVSVSAGWGHSCGVRSDGSVACWDDGGFGDRFRQASPPSGSFSAVSAGGFHSCALDTDDAVVCWGDGRAGRAQPPSGSFSQVSSGAFHSCGVTSDGSVACWGSGGGLSPPGGLFAQVSAGWGHSCGVSTDRSVVCWGGDAHGGASPPSGSFSQVSAGGSHSCGVSTNRSVVCWGWDSAGQASPPSGSFSQVSAGVLHSCGLRTDSTVVCWGDNGGGRAQPPQGSFSQVSAGVQHSCGVRTDSSVVCWGAADSRLAPAKPLEITLRVTDPSSAISSVYTVQVQRSQPASGRVPASAGRETRSVAASCDPVVGGCPALSALCAAAPLLCAGEGLTGGPGAGAGTADGPSGEAGSARASPQSTSTPGGGAVGTAMTPLVCPAALTPPEQIVTVTDPVLRTAILGALGKEAHAGLTAGELATLIELPVPVVVGGPRVSSLSGLEHATGLVSLDLTGHQITDIAPLGCLTGLTVLELGGNAVSDVSALSSLTSMEVLGLSANRITGLVSLSGLSSLEALDVSHNRITSVTALSGLTGLERLNVGGNQITDLGPLSSLAALEALYAYDNDITDIAGISALTGLAELYVDHNAITDITGLSSLTGLEALGVGGNGVTSLSAVSATTGLEALYAFDNSVTALPSLPASTELEELWVSGNDLVDATALSSLAALSYADMRFNRISDVSLLDSLSGTVQAQPQQDDVVVFSDGTLAGVVREHLGLAGTATVTKDMLGGLQQLSHFATGLLRISDLSGLEHATGLAELHLYYHRVRDISPILGLANLQRLSLVANGFTDMAQASQLGSALVLNLVDNGITDISELRPAPSVLHLLLNNNRITSIESLRTAAGLTRLELAGNQVSDIAPLAGLVGLDRLGLSGNPVASFDALSGLSSLRTLLVDRAGLVDLTPVSGLSNLASLSAASNAITDLGPLSGLAALRSIDLERNGITSLEPLRSLTRLQWLHVAHNDITNVEPLRQHGSLHTLYVAGNRIADFTPLSGLSRLNIRGRNDQRPPATE